MLIKKLTEDIVQDCFTKLWERRAKFAREISATIWIAASIIIAKWCNLVYQARLR
jgi:DNA-directed RNA polymerase specialized sigma24 family protein